MKRFALVFCLLTLAVPASAEALTTIGAGLTGSPTTKPANCMVESNNVPVGCTTYIGVIAEASEAAPGGVTAPSAGVVTRWRVVTGASTATSMQMRPRILHVLLGQFVISRSGTTRDISVAGGTFTFDDRLPIEIGDRLALDVNTNGPVAAGPVMVATIGTNASLIAKSPQPQDNVPYSGLGSIGSPTQTKLMINADVEPDVDLDGYGDETQDKCVQRSDVHDACPAPSVTGKAKPGSNGFTIGVDRAAKAKITLDRVGKGRKVGKKCKKGARRGKKCNVFTKFAQWDQDLVAGVNTISYAYKVGGKKLKKGSYRATIVITNAENLTSKQSFRFKVKR